MTKKKQFEKKLIKVPYIDQTREWPTGCESVSTVMLLRYLGTDISVKQFVDAYLEKAPLFEKDGKLYGADPRRVFVGDPADDQSMGCYAPVIRKALERVLRERPLNSLKQKNEIESAKGRERREDMAESGRGDIREPQVWEAVDLTGVPIDDLLREYIDCDIPVIYWASIDLKETYAGPEWIVADTGEIFEWRSNEHCMLLVGYDEENYFFNDPWHNHGVIGYEKELVEKRHKEQYKMAVSVRRREKTE